MLNTNVVSLSEGVLSFTSNAYLLEGKKPTLIDAGNDRKILESLKERTNDLHAILLTHLHRDHVGLTQAIKEEFAVEVYAWKKERSWIDFELSEGQEIEAGDSKIVPLHTPGHYPHHAVYFGDGALFSGDLIFPGGSFGRTDVPGGNMEELVESIKKVLEYFGGGIKKLYPGHMKPILDNAESNIKSSLERAKRY